MPRRARVSPDQILAAAALEFAERGYAGARVDRIARRAAVNKAMLYYHFRSKQQLYATLLPLGSVPRAVAGIVQEGVARGAFRAVHPVFAYFSILAPIVFYLAGTP